MYIKVAEKQDGYTVRVYNDMHNERKDERVDNLNTAEMFRHVTYLQRAYTTHTIDFESDNQMVYTDKLSISQYHNKEHVII